MIDSPIVRVEEGLLRGKLSHSPNGKPFHLFQGIPYAKPPVGELRFKAPQRPEPWEGIRNATAEGNSSAQVDAYFLKRYLGDEDCLYLNIYTPYLDGQYRPVMFYIHGGGYHYGSGSSYLRGGDYLVEKDVVVVTFNYRLGVLGFMSLNTPEVPGNAGMKDIVQALRWVKRNIKNFGGNPEDVTIFGESVGGVIVAMLTANHLTKDLISKAIIQSGVAITSWAFQHDPLENVRLLAEELGLEYSDVCEIYEYMRTVPVRDLVEAFARMNPTTVFVTGKTIFGPVIEKEFLGVEPFLTEKYTDILKSGAVANIPIIIGSNTLELTFDTTDDLQLSIPFDLNIKYNTAESIATAEEIRKVYFDPAIVDNSIEKYQLNSDFLFNIDTHRYVQYLLSVISKSVYYYKFGYVGNINLTKNILKSVALNYAGHMDELAYLFKNDFIKDPPTDEDNEMRDNMVRLWTNFAKTGNPTPIEDGYLNFTWQPAVENKLYYLNISNEISVGTVPDKIKMDFWDNLYRQYKKC